MNFRFSAFGRPVRDLAEFEKGIFTDLRQLRSGVDAVVEETSSPFLEFLWNNYAVRTKKKQKVFYWHSVPHDRLFLDALARDLRCSESGENMATIAVREPALSFKYDSSRPLFEQFMSNFGIAPAVECR